MPRSRRASACSHSARPSAVCTPSPCVNSCSANSPSRSSCAISSVTSAPTVTPWSATTSRSPESSGRKKSARQMRSCWGWRGKHEALELALGVLGIEDHQLVAVGRRREVAELGARVQVVLLAPHALEARREALLAVVALDDPAPVLALLAAPAPVQLEQHVAVEVGVDVVEVDRHLPRAPEGRLGDRARRCARRERTESSVTGGPSSTTTGFSRSVRASSRIFATSARARLVVDQRVHRVEALEGVLAVEDAGLVDLVGLLAVRVEDPPAEVAVDRGAADQHRELEPALVQLLHADRHLLGGRDEQRARGRSRRPRARPRR